jgi:hypothetical protein
MKRQVDNMTNRPQKSGSKLIYLQMPTAKQHSAFNVMLKVPFLYPCHCDECCYAILKRQNYPTSQTSLIVTMNVAWLSAVTSFQRST